LRACREEANEYIEIGALNGLFVLGRSIGFIGKSHTSELLLYIWLPDIEQWLIVD